MSMTLNSPPAQYRAFTVSFAQSINLINYYFVGMLIGLAIYNNRFLNLMFPSAFYKILLGKEHDLDMDDLR